MQPSSITLSFRIGQDGMIHQDEATEADAAVAEESIL
jgi:hypothetical protein